jgi:hypothetical protein
VDAFTSLLDSLVSAAAAVLNILEFYYTLSPLFPNEQTYGTALNADYQSS